MYVWKPKTAHNFELAYQCLVSLGQEIHLQLLGPDHPDNLATIIQNNGQEETFPMQSGVIVTVKVPFEGEVAFSTTLQNTVNFSFSS